MYLYLEAKIETWQRAILAEWFSCSHLVSLLAVADPIASTILDHWQKHSVVTGTATSTQGSLETANSSTAQSSEDKGLSSQSTVLRPNNTDNNGNDNS